MDDFFGRAGRSIIFGEGVGQIPSPALPGHLVPSGTQSKLTFSVNEFLAAIRG